MNAIEEISRAVKEKYPEAEISENPADPGFIFFIGKDIGQNEIKNPDIWLGYAIRRAEELGVIACDQAKKMLNEKPRELQTSEATKLMSIGTKESGLQIMLSVDDGSIRVFQESEEVFAAEKHRAVMECMQVVMFLLCIRSSNRPRSYVAA